MLARWPGRSYDSRTLNESPSEKEGKWLLFLALRSLPLAPSMKVPPKRKGNSAGGDGDIELLLPQ